MNLHPLKDSLINELHNRPFPVVELPAQVSSLVFLHSGDRQAELDKLSELAQSHGMPAPTANADCYYQSFDKFDLRWEYHNEFSTYTVIRRGQPEQPFCAPVFSLLGEHWVDNLEGQVIAANHIDLRPASTAPTSQEQISQLFNDQRLVGSKIYDGLATVWTSVQSEEDGFIRTLVSRRGFGAIPGWQANS